MAAHADLQACTDELSVSHLNGDEYVATTHPPVMPTDDGTADVDMWSTDRLFDQGMTIAQQVMDRAAVEGRVRHRPG